MVKLPFYPHRLFLIPVKYTAYRHRKNNGKSGLRPLSWKFRSPMLPAPVQQRLADPSVRKRVLLMPHSKYRFRKFLLENRLFLRSQECGKTLIFTVIFSKYITCSGTRRFQLWNGSAQIPADKGKWQFLFVRIMDDRQHKRPFIGRSGIY